jgi:DNA-binding NarL/FixJ family response regulator
MKKMRAKPANAVRVLLVDPNPLFRVGLRLLLEMVPSLRVVGDLPSAGTAPSRIRDRNWDLLLLDPGEDVRGFRGLRRAAGKRRILAISERPDASFALGALQAGADGFVSKRGRLGELLEAITDLAAGPRVRAGGRAPRSAGRSRAAERGVAARQAR